MSGSIKVSKNVTLKMENISVIEAVMVSSRKNFSVSLNIIIESWARMRNELTAARNEQKKINEGDKVNENKKQH